MSRARASRNQTTTTVTTMSIASDQACLVLSLTLWVFVVELLREVVRFGSGGHWLNDGRRTRCDYEQQSPQGFLIKQTQHWKLIPSNSIGLSQPMGGDTPHCRERPWRSRAVTVIPFLSVKLTPTAGTLLAVCLSRGREASDWWVPRRERNEKRLYRTFTFCTEEGIDLATKRIAIVRVCKHDPRCPTVCKRRVSKRQWAWCVRPASWERWAMNEYKSGWYGESKHG